jgi:hypothetical protein
MGWEQLLQPRPHMDLRTGLRWPAGRCTIGMHLWGTVHHIDRYRYLLDELVVFGNWLADKVVVG